MTWVCFGTLVSVFVVTYLTSEIQACLLTQDWELWNLTQRTQQAELVIVGNVKQYYPVVGEDPAITIFYTAEINVACVYGVGSGARDVAKNLYRNEGLVNVTGFNPLRNDCVHARIDVGNSYIVMVVGDWNGGNMRPDRINAQSSIVNATAANLRELAQAMTKKLGDSYQLTSGTCVTDNAINVEVILGQKDGATAKEDAEPTRLPPHRVMETTDAGGHGHRVLMHWLIVFHATLFALITFF